MKLKKIASLMLAGIMAVSMLAACGEGTGNNNGGASSSEPTTTTGYSAKILNLSTLKDLKSISAKDSTMLENAVKAAAAVKGNNQNAAHMSAIREIDSIDYHKTMLSEAKKVLGDATYEDWDSVKNIAKNDDNTVYDLYVVAANMGEDVINELVADQLELIFKNGVQPAAVAAGDTYSYDVSVAKADWVVGKEANVEKDGVIIGIAVTLHYDAAEFN